MTEQRRNEIRARLEAATPGPWNYDPRVGCVAVYSGEKRNCLATDEPFIYYKPGVRVRDGWETDPQHRSDAALIAHAPTDLADLLAEVERLREVLDAARQVASGDVPMLHLLSALDDYRASGGAS